MDGNGRHKGAGEVEARCGLNCRYEPRGRFASGWQREGSSRQSFVVVMNC